MILRAYNDIWRRFITQTNGITYHVYSLAVIFHVQIITLLHLSMYTLRKENDADIDKNTHVSTDDLITNYSTVWPATCPKYQDIRCSAFVSICFQKCFMCNIILNLMVSFIQYTHSSVRAESAMSWDKALTGKVLGRKVKTPTLKSFFYTKCELGVSTC